MAYLRRLFHIPVSESSLGLVLSICILTLSLMSIALVWQAQIIANQRDDIRRLVWAARFFDSHSADEWARHLPPSVIQ